MDKHIHAELIKAWADGAKIECYDTISDKWYYIIKPNWIPEMKYRIKVENEETFNVYKLNVHNQSVICVTENTIDMELMGKIKLTLNHNGDKLESVQLVD